MSVIYNWGRAGVLPKRITHNDTKFNNILFDADDNAECVIDLDTVMSGHVAYDFGDAIRTIINTTVEDEPDLDKIQINIPLFKAYAEGYINEAHAFLTYKEVESLFLGTMLLPYMQGVRFLTDYLQGDTYFKTAYPGHNLIRAKAQFQLLTKLEEQDQLLRRIIADTVADHKSKYKEEQNLG
jgi:Ser/Thr protein kinase RdoA (MazF antagonist)